MSERWSLRARLLAGESTTGCFLGLGSPSVTELLGHVGFDWLVLETEHSAVDVAQLEHMLRALGASGSTPIVRVPPRDPVFIQRALDLGAGGVIVPLIRSAEEAREVVAATRFPPQGTRSFGPLRAARYSLDYARYLETANDEMLVGFIIETREALESIEEIAAVPGVDVLFLGLFDLCLSLGVDPLALPLPEVDAAIERVLGAGARHGVAVGHSARSRDELEQLRARGFRFIGYGTDYFLLLNAARAAFEEPR
ncbi:MAG: 4-hydroxy-2-oxoheptanedioate aldolase [Gaiellales bacterium]|jgi:2-keto-3-deoxy-L-rhamnonate aldolase RhmA|nr:4-hydroxy-2-oxoheptanedioate aldolase [Gaiellales bacterium]